MKKEQSTTKSIVLVGMMGCGKSSVGLQLAKLLGWQYVDVDQEIERISNLKVAEIFQTYGEDEFRNLETRVLQRLLSDGQHVIATGGGAFMRAENRELIARDGHSVWLNASLETLWGRVKDKSHRPLLNNDDPKGTLSRIFDERVPTYKLAEFEVESAPEFTQAQVASKIMQTLGE